MKRVRVEKSHKTSPSPAQLRHGGISTGFINISLDLTVEILKKLPAKSLVRFQCVSKLWLSIISTRRDFIESILTRSLNQPPRDAHLIFQNDLGRSKECLFVFSSRNTEKESLLVPDGMHQFLRGLIFCWSFVHKEAAIYNPTTRQSFHLPKMKTSPMGICCLGYDPLENQYKALFLPLDNKEHVCQVFTLGDPTCKQWRTIQGVVGYHNPLGGAICINGAIYYLATTATWIYKLMRFDVRSEEFSHVEAPDTLTNHSSFLINYQGKLGFMNCEKGVEIWVREDGDHQNTQRWSKIFFYEMEGMMKTWRVSGVTQNGEIVLVNWAYRYEDMLNVYYYDPKQNSMRFVDLEICYPGESRRHKFLNIWTLPDYVENTMRLH